MIICVGFEGAHTDEDSNIDQGIKAYLVYLLDGLGWLQVSFAFYLSVRVFQAHFVDYKRTIFLLKYCSYTRSRS